MWVSETSKISSRLYAGPPRYDLRRCHTGLVPLPDVGCQNLGIRPDFSQTCGLVPIAARPSTRCVLLTNRALATSCAQRTFHSLAQASTRSRANGTRLWHRERRVATRPMKGEKAQKVSLHAYRIDRPLLAWHHATASCFSCPPQLHNSPTTHTACWLLLLRSQDGALQQSST